jgi:benzaldehyde dehydrogenase (NAD)
MSSATAGAAEYTAEVFIGGRFERPASEWLPVLDKAAGSAFARYGNASAAQVDRAVAAARQAQPAWAETDANTRCAVLRAFAA